MSVLFRTEGVVSNQPKSLGLNKRSLLGLHQQIGGQYTIGHGFEIRLSLLAIMILLTII